MLEPAASPEPTADSRSDLIRLAVAIALALVVRTWVVVHTQVPARDGVGFIRTALHFEQKRWVDVIRQTEQHPAYPLAVLAVSKPVRLLAGGLTPEAMVLSAQLVSLLAGVLMVVPVYFLGKSLFDRNAGFLAAALLQCLPVFVHVTSDALSESLFLLFVITALVFAVRAVRVPAAWRFFLAGVFAGLAYWTRPEGAEVVTAVSLVVAIVGLTRWGLRATTVRAAALAAGALPLIALYVGITGHLTNKPTGIEVIHGHATTPAPQACGSRTLLATFWDSNSQAGQSRTLWSLKAVTAESVKSTHYTVGALAVFGLWWFRRKLRIDAALWVLLAYAAMHLALLCRLAIVIGYVSERHTLPLVMTAAILAAAVIPAFWTAVNRRWHFVGQWAPATAVVLVMLSGVPSLLKPLHGNRAAHLAAGRWIAGRITDRDEVIDPFAWAHYYSGCVFREGKDTVPANERAKYVVLEVTPHPRLTGMALAQGLAQKGEPVYHWPEQRPVVVIYRVPAGR